MPTNSSDSLLQFLQKPVEIFSGVMPIGRELTAATVYIRRCKKKDAPQLQELMLKNRDYLDLWLQPQPEAISLKCINLMISEDHLLAKKGQRLDLGIYAIEDDRLLGRIALHSVNYGMERSAGVSYWIDEKESGKGYATQALATLIAFAFEECGLHRLWLSILKTNKASLTIANKLGFRKEGSSLQAIYVNGCWQDTDNFSILEEEYDSLIDSWIPLYF